jgi:hypothetical protein
LLDKFTEGLAELPIPEMVAYHFEADDGAIFHEAAEGTTTQ